MVDPGSKRSSIIARLRWKGVRDKTLGAPQLGYPVSGAPLLSPVTVLGRLEALAKPFSCQGSPRSWFEALFQTQFRAEMPLGSPRDLQHQNAHSGHRYCPLLGPSSWLGARGVGSGGILGQVGLSILTSKWGWETWPGCFGCPLLCPPFPSLAMLFHFPLAMLTTCPEDTAGQN